MGMQKNFFSRITENPNEEFDICFEISPHMSSKGMSLIEETLYKDIEYTTTIIKSLKHSKKKLKEYTLINYYH